MRWPPLYDISAHCASASSADSGWFALNKRANSRLNIALLESRAASGPSGPRSSFWTGRRLARRRMTLPLVSTTRCSSNGKRP